MFRLGFLAISVKSVIGLGLAIAACTTSAIGLGDASAQAQAPAVFVVQCAGCHGEGGLGTARGPALALKHRVAEQSADQLDAYLQRGNVAAGMPAFADLDVNDRAALVRYLRRINVETITRPAPTAAASRPATWGAPQPGDWRTYNGSDSGNRYSALKQITTDNVSRLGLKWVFPIPHFGLETTPLAADGVLYVTGPNQVFAIRRAKRQNALALPDQRAHESLADDVHRGWPAVRASPPDRISCVLASDPLGGKSRANSIREPTFARRISSEMTREGTPVRFGSWELTRHARHFPEGARAAALACPQKGARS